MKCIFMNYQLFQGGTVVLLKSHNVSRKVEEVPFKRKRKIRIQRDQLIDKSYPNQFDVDYNLDS